LIISLLVFEGEKLKIFANWSKKLVEVFEGLYRFVFNPIIINIEKIYYIIETSY